MTSFARRTKKWCIVPSPAHLTYEYMVYGINVAKTQRKLHEISCSFCTMHGLQMQLQCNLHQCTLIKVVAFNPVVDISFKYWRGGGAPGHAYTMSKKSESKTKYFKEKAVENYDTTKIWSYIYLYGFLKIIGAIKMQ